MYRQLSLQPVRGLEQSQHDPALHQEGGPESLITAPGLIRALPVGGLSKLASEQSASKGPEPSDAAGTVRPHPSSAA